MLISDPVLAAELTRLFDAKLQGERAWKVTLHDNRLRWSDGQQVWTRDPEAGVSRRFLAWLARVLPIESQLWNLREARRTVKKLFDVDTFAYARQKSAFHPQLPSWLHHLGYKHAVLVSFDSATIPSLRGTAANWPGPVPRRCT